MKFINALKNHGYTADAIIYPKQRHGFSGVEPAYRDKGKIFCEVMHQQDKFLNRIGLLDAVYTPLQWQNFIKKSYREYLK
jgi:hypothetical protein